MYAIYRKELRDILRWVPVGLIVIGWLAWMSLPTRVTDCSELPHRIVLQLAIGLGLFAFALGALQSFPDLRTDARAFLLHRPVSSQTIFWAKLWSGLTAYAIAVVPPFVLITCYLEWNGPEKLPSTWLQAVPAMISSMLIFLLHPAASWMACRDARWWGTRTFPLVFSIAAVSCGCLLAMSIGSLFTLITFLAVAIVTTWITLKASLHAFTHQAYSPPASSPERWTLANAAAMMVVGLLIYFAVASLVFLIWAKLQSTAVNQWPRFALRDNGELWYVVEVWDYSKSHMEPQTSAGLHLQGAQSGSTPFEPLPVDWKEKQLIEFGIGNRAKLVNRDRPWFSGFRYIGYVASEVSSSNSISLWERDGLIYVFDNHGLIHQVTPCGVYERDAVAVGRFKQCSIFQMMQWRPGYIGVSGQSLLYGDDGLYQLNLLEKSFTQLASDPISEIALTPGIKGSEAELWTYHSGTVRSFRVTPRSGSETLPTLDDRLVSRTSNYELPMIALTPTGKWNVDPLIGFMSLKVGKTEAGDTVIIETKFREPSRYKIVAADNTLMAEGVFKHEESSVDFKRDLPQILLAPPILRLGVFLASILSFDSVPFSEMPFILWIVLAGHFLVAGTAAYFFAGRLGQMHRVRLTWSALGSMFGLGTIIGMTATYAQSICEPCPHCEKSRDVDAEICSSCGGDWPAMAGEDIEILSP